MNGTLYAVGVGPGAPDLLTLRAARVLGGVDVILAAASPRNDYSAALETARPPLRADARILRLEFPMTREEAPLRAAWRAA
uniref:SAM-dependent methyltransferase n=1 Tax=uncultured Desulfovibrio sp. TaxID=167968 RepID=UPI002611171B